MPKTAAFYLDAMLQRSQPHAHSQQFSRVPFTRFDVLVWNKLAQLRLAERSGEGQKGEDATSHGKRVKIDKEVLATTVQSSRNGHDHLLTIQTYRVGVFFVIFFCHDAVLYNSCSVIVQSPLLFLRFLLHRIFECRISDESNTVRILDLVDSHYPCSSVEEAHLLLQEVACFCWIELGIGAEDVSAGAIQPLDPLTALGARQDDQAEPSSDGVAVPADDLGPWRYCLVTVSLIVCGSGPFKADLYESLPCSVESFVDHILLLSTLAMSITGNGFVRPTLAMSITGNGFDAAYSCHEYNWKWL